MDKFRRAQAVNRASIELHLNNKYPESSSDEENSNNEALEKAVNIILSSYQSEGGDSKKTSSYLSELFQSDGAVCLICISSVKKANAIWSCSTCYSFMHLTCIQRWIRDSLIHKHEKDVDPSWTCPKCRREYTEKEIPSTYLCFCGRTTDPIYQPWSIPHSCGEPCGKMLQPLCGHHCLLLCHPGPCPPCPKTVPVSCFCGKQPPRLRRCNAKLWSCKISCDKILDCGHHCRDICHSGLCPPCSEPVFSLCHCGNERANRKCNESSWKCKKLCGKLLSCKVHHCDTVCHRPEDCGDCPLAKNRTCPCGKKKYQISCSQRIALTCGDTCEKILNCKSHYCSQRCHPDSCGQCLEVVQKTCKCGSFTKETACVKDFHCNKKCTQMRLCGRHPCNKKCCDCIATNNYNTCEKICENTLNCRKHKCPAPCHSGPCYPCPQTVIIQCRCGNSKITVPCGTKKAKPPKCNRMCKIPPNCHHLKSQSHKCHPGPCPPCKKICGLVYKQCGHECKVVCHTKVWVKVLVNGVHHPSGPWETPQEKMKLQTLPCPPCEVSVMVTCLGGHETKNWPCYTAISSSCLRLCGQKLPCGNHTCELLCHKLKIPDHGKDDGRRVENEEVKGSQNEKNDCMPCERPCELPRSLKCIHACPKPCHPAPCFPCQQLIKVPCHCGINSVYRKCFELNSTALDINELLKCGNQCPKLYSCHHRCVDNCHPGPCRDGDKCNKRVKVACKCARMRKNFSCLDVREGKAKVDCNQDCDALRLEKKKTLDMEIEKKLKEKEMKNRLEMEKFERKFKPRKKIREKVNNCNVSSSNNRFNTTTIILVGIVPSILGGLIIYYTNIIQKLFSYVF